MSARNATTLPALPPAQNSDDAGVRDAGRHVDVERLQMGRDQRRGAHFAIGKFRVFVDIAAPRDHVAFNGRGAGGDVFV
jgi:hypothetical protein